MRRAAAVIAGLFAVAAVALAAAGAWLYTRDPMASLPREPAIGPLVVEERHEPWQGRTLVHVALHGEQVGRVRFVVSLPDPLPPRPIPLVVVLGGLRGGSDSVREITAVAGDLGPNAFVGYDWPLPLRSPGVGAILRRLPEFRRGVLAVPGQVEAIRAWASQKRWLDPGRVSLLGFSLGAFVVPAAQRLAQQRGATARCTILGYAGAPIGAVIAGHPRAGPAWLRPVLGATAGVLLRPVEPSLHLPHLRGRFLVLAAGDDRLIAREASERMAELTPEPRTVRRIAGDHMGVGPDKRRLLAQVIEVSRSWLVAERAIDPPTGQRPRETRAP
jgi:hypothetical protein